jgi:exopolysaccharide biosynthesis polyprenyl glycosylphosphotransferase
LIHQTTSPPPGESSAADALHIKSIPVGAPKAVLPARPDWIRRMRSAAIIGDALCAIGVILALHGVSYLRGLSGPKHLLVTGGSVGLWILVFHLFGMYRLRHRSAWDEFRGTVSATGIGLLLIAVGTSSADRPLARATLVWAGLIALGSELLARRVVRGLTSMLERLGRLSSRTALVGVNGEAHRLAHTLAESMRGLVPVGYVGTAQGNGLGDGLPVIGDISSLERIIHDYSIECVVVASSDVSPADMQRVSRACRTAGIDMKVSANLPEALISRLSIERFGDVTTLALKPVRLTRGQAVLKRCFDLAVGSIVFGLALPVIALVALIIRFTSRGPALFRQVRVTKGGKPFTMYKFRTMVRDPHRVLDESVIDLTKPFFKLRDDPRLTKVGRVLRAASLDELPQLWNVIRGDMSLVGPRPLPVEQVEANAEFLSPRHEVPGGITGWWQVSGRSDLDSVDALRQDLFYIENWSLGLDAYILLRTIGAVLTRKGAR